MTAENDVLLEKIEHLSETVRKQWEGIKEQSADISEIKKTVSIIAVQSNRIDNLSGQVGELWMIRKTHDEKISEIEKFQASCPRDIIKETHSDLKSEMRETMKRQWVIISLLALIVLGSVLKVAV